MRVEIDLNVDELNDHIKAILDDEMPDFDDIKEDQDLVTEDEVECIMENKLEELVKNEMDLHIGSIREAHVREIIRNSDTISNLQKSIDMLLIRVTNLENNNIKTAGSIWKDLQAFVEDKSNAEGGH